MPLPILPPSPIFQQQQEVIIQSLVGGIPASLGISIRNRFYRILFNQMGKSVQIETGARFLESSRISIGDNVKIHRDVHLDCRGKNSQIIIQSQAKLERGVDIRTHPNARIEIGRNVYLGPYTCVSGQNITIGDRTLISSHCSIYASNHLFADPHRPIQGQGYDRQGIMIENDCWLGTGVRVLDGVTIAQGSVIGAGAVVTKNIPAYSIAVGVPAKVIASREPKALKLSI